MRIAMIEWRRAHRESLVLYRNGMTAFVWKWCDRSGKVGARYTVDDGTRYIAGGMEQSEDAACEAALAVIEATPTPPERSE